MGRASGNHLNRGKKVVSFRKNRYLQVYVGSDVLLLRASVLRGGEPCLEVATIYIRSAKSRPAHAVARNVSKQEIGGFICEYAAPAGMSAVATIHRINTRPRISTRQAIRLSKAMTRPKAGGWCYIDEVMLDLTNRATPQIGPIPRYY